MKPIPKKRVYFGLMCAICLFSIIVVVREMWIVHLVRLEQADQEKLEKLEKADTNCARFELNSQNSEIELQQGKPIRVCGTNVIYVYDKGIITATSSRGRVLWSRNVELRYPSDVPRLRDNGIESNDALSPPGREIIYSTPCPGAGGWDELDLMTGDSLGGGCD